MLKFKESQSFPGFIVQKETSLTYFWVWFLKFLSPLISWIFEVILKYEPCRSGYVNFVRVLEKTLMKITVLEYSPWLNFSDTHATEGLSCGSHYKRTGTPMHPYADISIALFGSNKIRGKTFFPSPSSMNSELAIYK